MLRLTDLERGGGESGAVRLDLEVKEDEDEGLFIKRNKIK